MNPPQKLLLIDDDPLVAQLIGMLVEKFRGAPFTLEHAADYAGGLARLLPRVDWLSLVGGDLAVRDSHDAMGVRGNVAVVGHDDDRVALCMQVDEDGHDLLAALAVQRPGRLVGEDDGAAVHERTGDADALLLPARQLIGMELQPLTQAQFPQQVSGVRLARGFRHAAVDGWHLGVFHSAQVGHQVVALEDEPEGVTPEGCKRIAAERGHVGASYPVRARRWRIETADDVHQRRLARARRAHDRDELTALDDQVDVGQDGQRLAPGRVGPADALEVEERRRH